MKIYKLVFVLTLSGLLMACATTSQKTAHGQKIKCADISNACEFLNFSTQFSSSVLAVQKQVLILTNQSLALNPTDTLQRMKLVMIYALPKSQLQDTQKAQNLLQNLLQENILVNTQLSFAQLLLDQLLAYNRLIQKSKDEQKRIENLQLKNNNLQLNLEATEQKIQELRNIEKLMGERNLSPPILPK